ncbi:hypothetical protein KDH_72190 [Dictyobacter sp. S3.2.2.5]|uniref:Uncharacterized protein n=1 Tax=Dictyobacter halimunensis TaxID=3026934 RepID=A0ABQ6G314_9CHLR|nr:hypothetical protein KDH_72190 [Dictyobacter sp. S3.2.2.5]
MPQSHISGHAGSASKVDLLLFVLGIVVKLLIENAPDLKCRPPHAHKTITPPRRNHSRKKGTPRRVDLQRSAGPRATAIAAHVPGRFGFSWKTRRPTWYPASNVHFWVPLSNVAGGYHVGERGRQGKRYREGAWAAVAGAGSPVDR